MNAEAELLAQGAEELFEEAPCGYLATDVNGTIIRVNRTFERWTGLRREDLVGRRRFAELLSAGGRIYHETHYHPLLMMQASVREIAFEIRRADGTLLPVLVNSVLHRDAAGTPRIIRTTIFDATDRRGYERELLAAQRREHEVALRLQRSLLSGELPQGPRFTLEVHYLPAGEALEIGGDWYDAFPLDDDTVGLVVGDVVGRGIEAAATMGQLRSAVRALAATGLGPAALLEALDAFAHRHDVGRTATLVYAQLRLTDNSLCFAVAGHPPPVLAEPGADARLLWEGRSWPLDVPQPPSPRPEARCTLAPGSTLLLYTDGLVEHRGEPIGTSFERLTNELGRRHDEALATLVPALARQLALPARTDDVCLLGVRLSADG